MNFDKVIINNKELNNIPKSLKLYYTNSIGSPTLNMTPSNLLPNKLYLQKYTRFSNSLPITCPNGYDAVTDNIPNPNNGNLDFGKSLTTGLPICKSTSGETCYPQEISLMGENMFSDRGIKKCSDAGDVKFGDTTGPITLDRCMEKCDGDNKCQGFITSNETDGMHCRFINDGLDENYTNKIKRLGSNLTIGGTKYTTYVKNRNASGYTSLPWNAISNVTKVELGIGKESFVGSHDMLRNSMLLLVVVLLIVFICKGFMF